MTITFTCPGCNKRFDVSDANAGTNVHCDQCGSSFTAPRLPSRPPVNPYESPPVEIAEAEVGQEPQGTPIPLVLLIVLCGLHLPFEIGIFVLGMTTANPLALFGGLVTFAFYVAILFGLIRKQEWARIMIIWLSYVGIVASRLVFAPIAIPTLICAHWPSVRRTTKGASMAAPYVYHEDTNDEGEPTP